MAEDRYRILAKFLVPEKEISLKVVFDNIRNYAIVGGIFALAHWLQSGRAGVVAKTFPAFRLPESEQTTRAFFVIGAILFVMNAAQTTVIFFRASLAMLGDSEIKADEVEPFTGAFWKIIIYCVIPAVVICVYIALIYMVFKFAITVALFAAVGNSR